MCCVPFVEISEGPVKDDSETASRCGDQGDVNYPPQQPPEEARCLEVTKLSNPHLPSQRKHVSLVLVDEWLDFPSREHSRQCDSNPVPLSDSRLGSRPHVVPSPHIGHAG